MIELKNIEKEFDSIITVAKVLGYNCYFFNNFYVIEYGKIGSICLNPHKEHITLLRTGKPSIKYYSIDLLKKELLELL